MKQPKDYFTKKMRNRGLRYSIHEGIFATIMSSVTTASFVSAFALALGATEIIIGLISSIPLILWTIAQIPAARLVEKTGKRKKIAYTCAFISRFMWLPIMLLPFFMFTESIALLIAFLSISSFFGAMIGPAWASWMGDLVPVRVRGKYFGKRNMILSIFTIIGTLFAGIVLDVFPRTQTTGFVILFLIGGIMGVISSFVMKATPEPLFKREKKREPVIKDMKKVLSNKKFKKLLVIYFIWQMSISIAAPFFVVRLLRDIGADYIWVSIQIIIATVFSVITYKFWGRFADRFGNRAIMAITSFGAASLPLMWLFIREPIHIIPLEIVSGIAWAGFNLAIFNYLLEISPEEKRPTYSAIFWTVLGLGGIIGPIIGGVLAEYFAHSYLFIFTGLEVVFVISWLGRLTGAFLFLYTLEEVETREKVKTGYVFGEILRTSWHERVAPVIHLTNKAGTRAIALSGYGFKKTMHDISGIINSMKDAHVKIGETGSTTSKKFLKTVDNAHKTTHKTIKSMPHHMRIIENSELEPHAEKVKKEIIRTKYDLKEKADKIARSKEPLKEKDVKKLTGDIQKISKRMGRLTYDVRKFKYHYKKKGK